MAMEKRYDAVSQNFTANGTALGIVTVADASGFFAKQQVTLYSNTQSPAQYEVKIVTRTTIQVGPTNTNIDQYSDVSAFLVADVAVIVAGRQQKSNIKPDDILAGIYARDPAVALRNLLVDKFGTPYDSIVGGDGKTRLAVDAAVSVTGISVDLKGVYDAVTNPTPDNVGIIAHSRSVSPGDAQQTQRLSSKQGTVDTDVRALDVSLHDQLGNAYTSLNPVPSSVQNFPTNFPTSANTSGTTHHFNGTVSTTPASIPAVAGNVITSIYIENFNNLGGVNLLISFDAGTTFKTIERDAALYVEPKGDLTQVVIKGSSATTNYEIILNRKP
jgi:hypothetical protein